MINIQDAKSKVGLAGVSVVVFDADANIINTFYTDQYGQLDDSYFLYALGPSFIGLDANGYADATFSVPYLSTNKILYMTPLTAGTITPNPASGGTIKQKAAASEAANTAVAKQNMMPYLLIGGAIIAGALILGSKRKKKIGRINFEEVKPWLPVAGIVVIAGVVYYKVFGATPETKAYNDAIDTAVQSSGPTSLSAGQIAIIADTLENDLNKSSISNDTADAVTQLSKLGNIADVYSLIKAFGSRWQFFFGIPRGKSTLQQFLTGELSSDELATVNRNLMNSGINFSF